MEKEYYLLISNEKTGPFKLEELKEQNLKDSYLIWFDELDNWKKITEVPEIASFVKKTPPPIPNDTLIETRRMAVTKSIILTVIVFSIVFIIFFALGGGFFDDVHLRSMYNDYHPNNVYLFANELRYQILPLIAGGIALVIAIIVYCGNYYGIIRNKKKELGLD